MKLQTQPNRWSCLPTAFAIVMNLPIETIIKAIGHDGSTIIRSDAMEPDNRQSFHIQELIDVAWNRGYSITPFEPQPISTIGIKGDHRLITFADGNEKRILSRLEWNSGVLTGQSLSGSYHAVAWDHNEEMVYNPNGTIHSISEFRINTFWCLAR